MKPTKACPIVLRAGDSGFDILIFKHPCAGYQFVKGTIERGESLPKAAVRELREESGIDAEAVVDLGVWDANFEGQVWALQLCKPSACLPDAWTFYTEDDGGHAFEFSWCPLQLSFPKPSHRLFHLAMDEIQTRVNACVREGAIGPTTFLVSTLE